MNVLTVILVIALVATVAVLLMGIVSMARGGQFDQQHSHEMMFTRIGLHAVVVVLLLAAIYFAVY